ncbi:MAG: efflux RND transporter periplasmic adaptor subunit, partial [Halieaceae bacterium]
ALTVWLGSGFLPQSQAEEVIVEETLQAASVDSGDPRVRVSMIASESRTRQLVLRGKTESKRMVDVKAEIAGSVVARPVERGTQVSKGDLLCEVAIDDREVALQEAQAALQTAEIEHQGSLKLKKQGLLSDVAIANSEARQEAARAHVHRQELNLARTRIVAPFSGVVEDLHMNVGDYAMPGESCATLIDLDPMLIVAQVTENEVDSLIPNQSVSGQTSTGRSVSGLVSFVGKQSDAMTRTYPVEITVENSDYSLRSGLTVSLRVGVDKVLAHRVAPSLLTLNDAGQMGLRIVNGSNRVEFKVVEILEDGAEGMWITGLPETVSLITVGQEYVAVGDVVEPVFSSSRSDQIATL